MGLPGAAPQVYRYFAQRFGPRVAAGIVGNTTQESSNDPNARGGGLIQGQGGRTSSGTLQQQLGGVLRELQGPERGTLQALRGAKSPEQAARIFSERFERPGIPMLGNRERYAREAAEQFAHIQQGGEMAGALAPHVEGEGEQAGPAQVAALVAQLSAKPQQGSSVAQTTLARPEGGNAPVGPRVPAPLQEPQGQSPDPAAILQAVSELSNRTGGTEAPTEGGAPPSTQPQAAGGALRGILPHGAKLVVNRTDKGKDVLTNPGGALLAPGRGRVVAVPNDPSGFGPAYPVIQWETGPLAGHTTYFGHVDSNVKAGQQVHAGQVVAHTSRSGHNAPPGWVEIGLWGPSGPLQSHGDAAGPAGKTISRLLGLG